MNGLKLSALTCVMAVASTAAAGPYPAFDANGVGADSITSWATILPSGGYQPSPGVVEFDGFGGGPHNNPAAALGAADGASVSLGDLSAEQIAGGVAPGQITLAFEGRVFDAPGADFAVFENAGAFFGSPFIYAELGFVEVSSNGVDFARFPSVSRNVLPDDDGEAGEDELLADFGLEFAGLNTTNVHNLVGVHPTLTGTPFDLTELATDALVANGLVDLDAIRFVRIVDIPGTGAFVDSLGNPIFDAHLTVESGGVDLDAIGAIHSVPEPGAIALAVAGFALALFVRRRAG